SFPMPPASISPLPASKIHGQIRPGPPDKKGRAGIPRSAPGDAFRQPFPKEPPIARIRKGPATRGAFSLPYKFRISGSHNSGLNFILRNSRQSAQQTSELQAVTFVSIDDFSAPRSALSAARSAL